MNILVLMSDQQRWDTLGCLNPSIKTPALDRLAAEGTVFERAYPTCPVCLPCRTSYLTGQYPSSTRANHNHTELPESVTPTLGSTFRDRGYYTHMIGKSHFSNCHDPLTKESAPHIHNVEYYRSWKGPWYGFERADISIGHSTEKHACGMHYGAWLEDHGVDRQQYFGHTSYEQYGPWDLPEEFHSSKWVADMVIDGIGAAQKRDQPFLIWANFQDPHNPCMVPEPWASMYDPEQIPRFGFKPGEPECFDSKPPLYRDLMEQPGQYACKPSDPDLASAGNVSHLDWNSRQVQENAACYYGMVSLMDHHVARILDSLDERGLTDDTLVIFTSDHGDLLGDHGLWWKSLVAYEESLRVPMIARLPGRIPAGKKSAALQSLVDHFPTFCKLTDVPAPIECEGRDQSAVWLGEKETEREMVIVEERPSPSVWNERIIISQQYKLVYYAGRENGELYDTDRDPDLISNLWDSPDYRLIKEKLIRQILDHEMNKRTPRPSPGVMAQ